MSDPTQTPSGSDLTHWCYTCNKQVGVQTVSDLHDLICHDCHNGFIESIPSPPPRPHHHQTVHSVFGNQFINALRRIAESDPPSDESNENFPRFDIEDEEDDQSQRGLVIVNEDEDEENDEADEDEVDEEAEEIERRSRSLMEALHRILAGDEASLVVDDGSPGAARRNRMIDWAEILMGLDDHSIDFRLQESEMDSYIGDPGDYVDAAGYEELLQNLAESDNGGRRGAPPAAKSAVEGLDVTVINTEEEVVVCAVCKDFVNVGEKGKKLPCGHLYHGECIVPWLGARNSCPICRYELPTDDVVYEEERKKKLNRGKGCSSSGVGVGVNGEGDDGPRREDH